MKRIVSLLFAISTTISLCACNTQIADNSTVTEQTTTTTEISTQVTETVTETETTTSETITETNEMEHKTPSLKNKYTADSLSLSPVVDFNDILQSLNPEKYRDANVICDGIEQGDVRIIYLWDDPHCKEKDPSTLTLAECTQDIVELYINNSDQYVAIDGFDSTVSSREIMTINVLPPKSVNSRVSVCTATGFTDVNSIIPNETYAYVLNNDNYLEKIANEPVKNNYAFPSFEEYKTQLNNRFSSTSRYRVTFDDFWSAVFHFYGVKENTAPISVNILYFNDANQLVSTDSVQISDDNIYENIYNVNAASGYGFATNTLVLPRSGITNN